jgi:CheY-like chemotaxis protein
VLTSALADPPEHAHLIRHGATAIVSKPFSSQRLLEIVRTLARPRLDNDLPRAADHP